MLSRVRLFTRPGCTLCDSVKFIINKVKQKHPFEYSEVNIDLSENRSWLDQYDTEIPVIHLNDKEIARHKLTEQQLITQLERMSNH